MTITKGRKKLHKLKQFLQPVKPRSFLTSWSLFSVLTTISLLIIYFPLVVDKQLFTPVKNVDISQITTYVNYDVFAYHLAIKYNLTLFALGILIVILTIIKDKAKKYQWLPKIGIAISACASAYLFQEAYYSIVPPIMLSVLGILAIISLFYQQIPNWYLKCYHYSAIIIRNLIIFGIITLDTFWIMLLPSNTMNGPYKYPLTNEAYQTIFAKPVFWLNVSLIFLLYLFLRMLTRRFWSSAIVIIVAYNFFYLFERIIDVTRDEAIVPQDLSMLKNGGELASMISPLLTSALITSIILMIIFSVSLNHIYPVKKPHWYNTVFWTLIFIACYGSTSQWNNQNSQTYKYLQDPIGDQPYFLEQNYGAILNGPWVQFLNNIDIHVMQKPNGYSKQTMAKLARQYQKESRQVNQHRPNKFDQFTVIYNLSESFADPARVPGLKYQGHAFDNLHQLDQDNVHGLMLSSGYGGGTANMEFMAVTGFNYGSLDPTLSIPYIQLVSHQNHFYSVARQFKHTSAIHPYDGNFYDRATVYPHMGIKQFYNLNSKKYRIKHRSKLGNTPYLSDKTAYANVIDRLNEYHRPQFINLVTIQNHTPFDNHFPASKADQWQTTNKSGTDNELVNQYLTEAHQTDIDIKHFSHQLNRSNRPIVWVFYGDHLPGFYQNNMETDGVKMHETDYFIFMNHAAKKLAHRQNNPNQWPMVAPENFTNMAKQMTNSKISAFEALQDDTLKELPIKVKNTGYNCNSQNQEFNHKLQWIDTQTHKVCAGPKTKQQKQLWHDFLLVQYDQTAGKHYLSNNFFQAGD